MAKPLRRTVGGFDSASMPGSSDRVHGEFMLKRRLAVRKARCNRIARCSRAGWLAAVPERLRFLRACYPALPAQVRVYTRAPGGPPALSHSRAHDLSNQAGTRARTA